MSEEEIEISIIYDNKKTEEDLVPGWGFSASLNLPEEKILFDVGADSMVLEHNMKAMGVRSEEHGSIFISHPHCDHTGGLSAALSEEATVYILEEFPDYLKHHIEAGGSEYKIPTRGEEIGPGLFCTGKMEGEIWNKKIIEQSLLANTSKGPVLITGCAHPGVVKILKTVREITGEKPHLALGGFHLKGKKDKEIKRKIDRMGPLVEKIAPCHCTGEKGTKLFKKRFEEKFIAVGAGKTVKI